jgi:Holliday junction resolvasome RuvABC endonuclease subunit
MNQTISKQVRILAVAPTARGFGYCVMENNVMLECGRREAKGNKNAKNAQVISKVEKLMNQFLPEVLVLQDVKAADCRRAPRIKMLHRQIVVLAEKHKCKVMLFSGRQLRITLLGNAKGTKHEMAEMLVKKFPTELGKRLPPKRRAWDSEDGRMDVFDAVGLAITFCPKGKYRGISLV